MYPVIGILALVLLQQGPLARTTDALPAKAYSDGGPLPLSEQDIDILERLAKEEIRQDKKTHSSGDSSQQKDDELEIDLAPFRAAPSHEDSGPNEGLSDSHSIEKEVEKKGQEEFISLVDPVVRPNARQANIPVVEVKRRPAGENIFSDPDDQEQFENFGDTLFVAVTTACSIAAVFGLVAAGFCWFKLHKQHSAAANAAYPQYGGVGPAIGKKKSPTQSGDASLAYSAQLHHFNQTKQKILNSEQPGLEGRGGNESEESEGEGDEADYSVYECPGLAPTGDIEVANPLFENASPKSKDAPKGVQEE